MVLFKEKKEYPILDYHKTLAFKLEKNFHFLYGVLVEYKGSMANHFMHFLCEVKYLSDYAVEINQKQVYLNDQLPDLMMETLADDIRKKLYPVTFNLGTYGSLISIRDYEGYKERWYEHRERLENRYKGILVLDILDKVERNIEDHRKCLEKFRENLFLQLMFLPLYDQVFNADYKRSVELNFKLYKDLPVFVYKVDLRIAKEKTSTGNVFIVMNGELKAQEHDDYYNITSSVFQFFIKLNEVDKTLFSIEGEINSLIANKNEQIKFSSFQQE